MKRLIILFLLSITLFANKNLHADDRALLIGISNYTFIGPNLVGPRNDVSLFQDFLITTLKFRRDQVKAILDNEAGKQNILAQIEHWLVNGTSPEDTAILYYSGHGYFQPDKNMDEPDGLDETLVSSDTRVSEDGNIVNMITDDEIRQILKKMSDRKVVLIIDSCHSGTISRGLSGNVNEKNTAGYKRIPQFRAINFNSFSKGNFRAIKRGESFVEGNGNLVVWSAVSATQSAFENIDLTPRRGVFTNAFVNGIQKKAADRNGNGIITNSELLDYIQVESEAFCDRYPKLCTAGLTPSIEASPLMIASPVLESFGFENQVPGAQADIFQEATDILSHSNTAKISMEILPDNHVRLGDKIRFSITSPVDGYLLVLDINPDNEITQLFPNQYSDRAGKGNRITASMKTVIPNSYYGFALRAKKPTGKGSILAIVTEDPVLFDDLPGFRKDLEIIPNGREHLADLAYRLLSTWREDEYNRRPQWSMAQIDYSITTEITP